MFDKVKIKIASGKGGDGAISFRREKSTAKGGPYGGDGGKGGSVYLVADRNMESFVSYRFKNNFRAEDGENGKTKLCSGKDGKDLILYVPLGTMVFDEEGHLLFDMVEDQRKVCICKGGRGGRGNASFKSSTLRTPKIAENGHEGETKIVYFELKTIADVGLVGFPNAGKSTILSSLTNARPLIAAYPFSTTDPMTGVSILDDGNRIVIADIPGLIEGASQGRGMGITFLRHIERCSVLLHCISSVDSPSLNLEEDFSKVMQELNEYSSKLDEKKMIICITKMDLVTDRTEIDQFIEKMKDKYEIVEVSALEKNGLDKLKEVLAKAVEEESSKVQVDEEEKIYSYIDEDNKKIPKYEIIKEADHTYRILGSRVIKTKRLINLSTDEGLDKLLRYLNRIGIDERLVEAGAINGDTVILDDFEFTFNY